MKAMHNQRVRAGLTSSSACLSLPLSTTTVVRGSAQRTRRHSRAVGCSRTFISLIWSGCRRRGASVDAVRVDVQPCRER